MKFAIGGDITEKIAEGCATKLFTVEEKAHSRGGCKEGRRCGTSGTEWPPECCLEPMHSFS